MSKSLRKEKAKELLKQATELGIKLPTVGHVFILQILSLLFFFLLNDIGSSQCNDTSRNAFTSNDGKCMSLQYQIEYKSFC